MAAALLRRRLDGAGIAAEVGSAGTGAWDGAPVSEGAYLVSLEHGIDLSDHVARLLTRELVDEADLLLTMARHHRSRVEELGGSGKAHLLGEYAGEGGAGAEVNDPFGGEIEAYRAAFDQLERLIEPAVDRLVKECAGD